MNNVQKQRQHRAAIKDRAVVYLHVEIPERMRDQLRKIAAAKNSSMTRLIQDALQELVNDPAHV